MSNKVFLFFLQLIIERKVMVNCWWLTFEFDEFYFVKALTKKIRN